MSARKQQLICWKKAGSTFCSHAPVAAHCFIHTPHHTWVRDHLISDSHSPLTIAMAIAIWLKDSIVWVYCELRHRLGLEEGITEISSLIEIIIAYSITMLFQEASTSPSAFNFPFFFFHTVHTFNLTSLNLSFHHLFSYSEGKSTQRS